MIRVFFLVCIFPSETYSSNKTLLKADSLYDHGFYEEAAFLYAKHTFQDDSAKNYALFQQVQCYKQTKNYTSALEKLREINMRLITQDDSAFYRVKYTEAFCAFMIEDYKLAEASMKQASFYVTDSSVLARGYLLMAMIYNNMHHWDKAEQYASNFLIVSGMNEKMPSLVQLYSKKELPNIKNRKLLNLFKFVPGLAQMYCGYPGEGLFNAGLNLFFFGFGAYQVWQGFYFTGYFTAAISINKLYFGGRSRADYLFAKRNAQEIQEFNQKFRDLLKQ